MKKTLAILLSLALVFCMIPGSAFATTLVNNDTVEETVKSVTIAAIADQTYTGAAITPEPVVTATIETTTYPPAETIDAQPTVTTRQVPLEKGTDYTVGYTNNENKGTATVTVTLNNGLVPVDGTATLTQNFEIKALDLSSAAFKITEMKAITSATTKDNIGEYVRVTYNGADISTTSLSGKISLTGEVDPKNGIVTATISSADAGNITGTNSKSFYMRSSITGAKVTVSDMTYTGSTLKPHVTVTLNNKTLTEGTDYEVTYDSNLVDAGPVKATVTGIVKYEGTATGTFEIKQRAFSNVSITIPNVAEGRPIAPVVKDGNTVLVKDKDYYFVEPSTSVAGTKSVEIIGKGNYTGKRVVSFTVIDSAKVFDVRNVTFGSGTPYYSGSYQYKDITVKIGNTTLRKDIDYKVTYTITKDKVTTSNSYALDAGTYTVTVTGIGSYSGTATSEFKILQIPIDYVTATAYEGYYTNNPQVTVKSIVNGVTFVKDKDYTVYSYTSSYNNKCYVTITSTGTGNLGTGQLEATFSVAGRNMYYCTAEFAAGSKQHNNYTGSTIKPAVRVRDGYTVLTQGSDYTLTYKNEDGKVVSAPKDAGTYIIEITGKGAYSGTITLYYYIDGTDISDYTVTLKSDSVKADGYAKTPVISSVKRGFYSTVSSSDYTVSYEDSLGNTVYSMKTPGTYKVIVTGKGGYSGSTYATFRIVGEPQEISIAKTSYKVYEDSDAFRIQATATGDGTGFAYVSSNPDVASVSASGVVTIHKLGRAKITVTTTGMKKSDPASDDVYVKVYPDKVQLSRKPWTEGKSGSLRVRWDKQDDVTYYEVRYSRDKSFKKGTYLTKRVSASELDYDTQSTRLSSLKSGKRYYVKVRAVKVVYNDYGQELKYYGKWSSWRSGVTK